MKKLMVCLLALTFAMSLTVALSIASFIRISVRPPRRKDDPSNPD